MNRFEVWSAIGMFMRWFYSISSVFGGATLIVLGVNNAKLLLVLAGVFVLAVFFTVYQKWLNWELSNAEKTKRK
jgi:hypothetical protein